MARVGTLFGVRVVFRDHHRPLCYESAAGSASNKAAMTRPRPS